VQRKLNEVIQFVNVSADWITKHDPDQKTKLAYAIRRVTDQAKHIIQKYQDQVQDAQVEHCLEKDGVIQKDARGEFQFSKEGLKALNLKLRELRDSEVSIEPYFATALPSDLLPAFAEQFEHFVLKLAANGDGDGSVPVIVAIGPAE